MAMKKLGLIIVALITISSLCSSQEEDYFKEDIYYTMYPDLHGSYIDQRVEELDRAKGFYSMIGKTLMYDYGDFRFEVVFRSDSMIFWRDLHSNYQETDRCKTIQVSPHTVMTSWIENDGSFVNLYSNFNEEVTSFFIRNIDGSYEGYSGTITTP